MAGYWQRPDETALVLGAALISLAGCGKSEDQSSSGATTVTTPDGTTVTSSDNGGGSYTVTDSKNGTKVVNNGRVVVAADGKSRTVTQTGTNANGKKFTVTAVYDKQ